MVGRAFEFDGDDEATHPFFPEPIPQQRDAPCRCGDDVAQEPIDGSVGLEGEGVAFDEAEAGMAHEVGAQRRTIHGGDAGTALKGDVAPTARTGAEVHAGLAGLNGEAEALFGFDEFGKGPARRGFVGRDVDGTGRERGEDAAEGEGLRSGRKGKEAGIGGGQAELNEGVARRERCRLVLESAKEMAAMFAETVAEGVANEAATLFAAVTGFVKGNDVETPRLGVGEDGESGEEVLAPGVDGVGAEDGGVGEKLAGEDERRRFDGQGEVAGNEAGRANLVAG